MVFIQKITFRGYVTDKAFVINLDEYNSIGIHLVALYMNSNNATFFDSFEIEYIPKEIEIFIGNKSVKANIDRRQAYYSIISGYFCNGFMDFLLKGKVS